MTRFEVNIEEDWDLTLFWDSYNLFLQLKKKNNYYANRSFYFYFFIDLRKLLILKARSYY